MQSAFVFIDNYQNEVDAGHWGAWLKLGKFDFRTNPEERDLYQSIHYKVFAGLHLMPPEGKLDAWLLLLGIDMTSPKTLSLLELYRKFIAL